MPLLYHLQLSCYHRFRHLNHKTGQPSTLSISGCSYIYTLRSHHVYNRTPHLSLLGPLRAGPPLQL
jgi:hypothetical protein